MTNAPADAPTVPRDALDLPLLRDGGRRPIPWDAPLDPRLDERHTKSIGRSWQHLTMQEHLAVGAFAGITTQLATVGCEPVVLALTARAVSDEVRHAAVCGRLATRYLGAGAVESRLAGVPRVPAYAGLGPRETALLHMVEMCCINETFTGVHLTEALALADDPCVHAAIASLLEDEIDHGRVGWAHLAASCGEGWGVAAVQGALVELLSRALGAIVEPIRKQPTDADPILQAHGILGGPSLLGCYARTIRDVLLPGFAAVGIDTRDARTLCVGRGWCAA